VISKRLIVVRFKRNAEMRHCRGKVEVSGAGHCNERNKQTQGNFFHVEKHRAKVGKGE